MLSTFVIRQYDSQDQESVERIFEDGMRGYIHEARGNLRHFMQLNVRRSLGKDLAQIVSSYGVHAGTGNFWVAEDSQTESIVGMIGVQSTSQSAAEIRRMSVLASHQRQGVGTMLLNHAESWCLERTLDYLTLTTLSNMKQASRFYEARGYREDYREPYPPKSKVPPEQSEMIHYKKLII